MICMAAAMAMATGYASATYIPIADTGYQVRVGNAGGYVASNQGLGAEAGSTHYFNHSQGSGQGLKDGITYIQLSALGVPSLQAGTYTLVTRVGSNGQNNWPGAQDMTSLTRTAGYAAGFMLSNPGTGSALADGTAALNQMVAFNTTNGVAYSSSALSYVSSPTAVADMLAKADEAVGFHADTWYSVTNTWTIAADSAMIGKDPYLGVGFRILSAGGMVGIDSATLTFAAIPEPATLGMVVACSGAMFAIRRLFC